jgi:serine/threonine protein kinase
MAKINHPACLSIVAFDAPGDGPFSIVTELMFSDLQVMISTYGWRSSDWLHTRASIIALGVAAGMEYVHSQNIIHRDLKPSNVLLDRHFYPRIGGFDVAKIRPRGAELEMDDGWGTVVYMPPERHLSRQCDFSADVYSYGILIYELITGREAFPMTTPLPDVVQKIRSGYRPDLPAHVSGFYANLIQRCWQTEPEMRPTFREIVAEADGFKLEGCDEREFSEYRHQILKLP